MSSARLLVGVLFHDFTRKKSFFRENGNQSRKWDRKPMKIFFLPSVISHRETEAPFAPSSDIGSAHNFGRCKNTSCSCTCRSCGHFQCPSSEQLAPMCFFSVIAAHFLTLSGLENLRFSKMEQNPTYNWADFRHFWDESSSWCRNLFYPNP